MDITKRSPFTGEENTRTIDITLTEYVEWRKSKTFVQDAFPHLSADGREFLMTGYTPEDWIAIFGDDE